MWFLHTHCNLFLIKANISSLFTYKQIEFYNILYFISAAFVSPWRLCYLPYLPYFPWLVWLVANMVTGTQHNLETITCVSIPKILRECFHENTLKVQTLQNKQNRDKFDFFYSVLLFQQVAKLEYLFEIYFFKVIGSIMESMLYQK